MNNILIGHNKQMTITKDTINNPERWVTPCPCSVDGLVALKHNMLDEGSREGIYDRVYFYTNREEPCDSCVDP
jgi:hypothetical protein